ncbi:unnamed protein product [Microthlaspi erraticum]|uniref:Uncharacterized protein n=1 Tax=Microthlaspi erraticum TaxID=1685480 RepID=A0A6D2L2A7_9BRAS|nr:unnamed protein product [Microthlaspi erraticum]
MLSKAKKGSHIRTRDNMGFEMKRLRFKCPPKNWEARSWSGDGRRPSGALHSTGFSLDRACGSPLPLPQSVWLLGLGGAGLARTVHRGSISGRSW